MWKNQSSIQSKFLNKMILIVFFSMGLWSLIWIYDEYADFKIESESLRSAHVESQKSLLKKEVTRVVRYINDMNAHADKRLETSLKNRVYEALQIATNIYHQNVNTKALPEIKKMIKDALRPIRFNQKRGYYFAVSMDGIEQLYPTEPDFEGKNVLNLKDARGNFVIQDEIQVIEQHGEGFVRHFWTDPEKKTNRAYPKLSFVKLFKPLNWYIGTGEYLNESRKQLQVEVLNHLINLRFETEGYFFGSTYQGDPLFSNGKITTGGGNVWNLTDPNGIKIIQEQRNAVNHPDGGFVYYSWNKLDSDILSPKVSFVKGFPEWEWTVGAGVYLDTIESTISKNRDTLFYGFKKKLIRSFIILIILLLLTHFWFKRISKQLQKTVQIFSSFLTKASMESVVINPKDIPLTEFQEIAIATNKMLEDRRRAENKLRKSEEKHRKILEGLNDAAYQMSLPDGKYEYMNQSAKNVFGYDAEQWLLKPMLIREILHPDFIDYFKENWNDLINGKVSKTYEYKIIDPQGNERWIFQSNKGIFNGEGALVGIEGLCSNITKRRHAEEEKDKLEAQLRQAQKIDSIGTLAGGIAHDFNNILYPIIGHTEMLLDDVPENSPFQKSLNQIYAVALRARDLTKQILTFSRQENSELKLVKMQPIIKEALQLIRSTIPTTIEINQDIQAECGAVKADPTQIHQIIMNLSTNASHAMEKTGGKLQISLKPIKLEEYDSRNSDLKNSKMKPGEYACLTVKDTGIGMHQDVKEKIFDPFFTTKEKNKGTGMGLSVVHGIVNRMGGFIQTDSKPGVGTEFNIYFPIEKGFSEEQNYQKSSKLLKRGTEHILLVDDDKDIVKMEQHMLERLGYQVTSHTNSAQALEVFRNNPDTFDLVITDMNMPNLSGEKLSIELIKIRPDIRILLCTGFSETISEERAMALGIKAFLMKPIMMKDFSEKINTVLEKNQDH